MGEIPPRADYSLEALVIYIGIDPGQTNLAMVAIDGDGNLLRAEKPTVLPIAGVQRLSYLMIFVKDFIDHLPKKLHPVEHILMESVSHAEKFGVAASGETAAAIKLALVGWYGLHNPVAYPTISAASTIKKFVTGKGNTKKDQMPLAVYKKWGFEHPDTNVVEAYGMAQLARAVCTDPLDLSVTERAAVQGLKRNTEWSPNYEFKKLLLAMTSSSESATAPTRQRSQASSPTPSTRVVRSRSAPSEPTPSTRRSSPAPSPSSTSSVPPGSYSRSPRRFPRRSPT